jgi:hypothetical protein
MNNVNDPHTKGQNFGRRCLSCLHMVFPTTEAQTAELFSGMGKTHGHYQLNLGASILSMFWGIITSRAISNSFPFPSSQF